MSKYWVWIGHRWCKYHYAIKKGLKFTKLVMERPKNLSMEE